MTDELQNILDVCDYMRIEFPTICEIRKELEKMMPDIVKVQQDYHGCPKRSKNSTILKLRMEIEEKLRGFEEKIEKLTEDCVKALEVHYVSRDEPTQKAMRTLFYNTTDFMPDEDQEEIVEQ